MLRAIAFAAVLGWAGVANGQTINISGFSGADGGWTTNAEVFNGQWTSGQVQAVQPIKNYVAGAMVTATRISSGWTVTLYHAVETPQGVRYAPFSVIGVYGASGTTVLPRQNGDPRPARTISVQ